MGHVIYDRIIQLLLGVLSMVFDRHSEVIDRLMDILRA